LVFSVRCRDISRFSKIAKVIITVSSTFFKVIKIIAKPIICISHVLSYFCFVFDVLVHEILVHLFVAPH